MKHAGLADRLCQVAEEGCLPSSKHESQMYDLHFSSNANHFE
ncbi:hypothetical Protein YC6258_01755 [Gynuella sunshinyii YC6258]|uniref:Uncharacterized protein n=1 Tax=Gynuella sunshinyii YC6258 TaxID=1445510 RepID=A0A0C5VTX8_9GAMM|nr:hypothetical Protein YC6258_01755 [Gynuella sunshinyii YC6258]